MALLPGSRLGPYEILAPIGAGGMGEVYRARDSKLDRHVVVKVLPESVAADPETLARFEREAKAVAALSHPNILSIFDFGDQDGIAYAVMELLDGETLRGKLDAGPITQKKAADYALQVAKGLSAAHEKGIVHRDLKPENLFVTRDGHLKILDFGLAKKLEPVAPGKETSAPTGSGHTEPGTVMGTAGYMSPEQVKGLPVDYRSDIFSFGAILYELLSGKKAFKRDTSAEAMAAIMRDEPPELSESGRNISPALDHIVRHCLEKNRERRFQSARDIEFALEETSSPTVTSGAQLAVPPTGKRKILVVAAAIVVLAAALLVIVAALLWRTRGGKSGAPNTSAPDRKSVAVLPFQNLSPDPENTFFADGMTEDILAQLSKVRDLKVISRSSVMRYKGTQKPIQTIASELGVATVLEGSVRRAGNRVRIVGQLIDARTDQHLWAETYDRELKDVFAIQSEVAQQIAVALRATLSPADKKRIEHRPTGNLAAYDQYLKGREFYNHLRKTDNETAIGLFQKALGLDSYFALAYAGLGDAYAQRALRFGFPQSWLESSLEMSRKAIALDPELAEGHKALGLAYYSKGAYRESLAACKKAIEINPNHLTAVLNLGLTLRMLGRLDEALPWILRGVDLDPKNPVPTAGVGSVYEALGDARQAERWLKRSLELQPDLGQAHAYLIYFYLRQRRDEEAEKQTRNATTLLPSDPLTLNAAAIAELTTGNLPRAQQLFEKVFPAFREARLGYRAGAGVETHLAYLRLRAGRRDEAKALLEESLATDRRLAEEGNQDWSVPYDTACVYALRGEKDEAFRWLDKAVEAGWRGWPLGTRDPLLDPLRSDPRFHRIEARLEELVGQMRHRAGLS